MVCVSEVAPRYANTFCKGIRKAEAWYFCFMLWKPRHRVAFVILIDVIRCIGGRATGYN